LFYDSNVICYSGFIICTFDEQLLFYNPIDAMKTTLFIFLILLMSEHKIYSQIFCPDTIAFTPANLVGKISWDALPTFSFPSQFKIVYEGPRLLDSLRRPLKHGFSHIANQYNNFGPTDKDSLQVKNRAMTWYNVAEVGSPQPWKAPCISPWNNDTINAYPAYWKSQLTYYAALYTNTQADTFPQVDLMAADIEESRRNGFNDNADYIDSLYAYPTGCNIPPAYLTGTQQNFVQKYERDMMLLYNTPLKYAKKGIASHSYTTKLSSYNDGPISTTWYKIYNHSWAQWQTDTSLVSYLRKDTALQVSANAPFYNNCDFISPDCYLFGDYPENLAFSLFQIEVNKQWSNKDIVLWEWLRYPNGNPIRKTTAEALAIFPLMSGANGMWLWDAYSSLVAPSTAADTTPLGNYDHYIKGLYRLSIFSNYFTGVYSIYIPQTAHYLFVNQKPVWRAVVKGNNILIGAQNPYALDTDTTYLPVSYGAWSNTIALIGKQIFLCDFSLTSVDVKENVLSETAIKVFPNPAGISFKIELKDEEIKSVLLYDYLGRQLEIPFIKIGNLAEVNSHALSSGFYLLQIVTSKNKMITRKLIIE